MAKSKPASMDTQADTHEPQTPAEIRVAYHAGPADIVFAGRNWRRGVAQPITPDELKSMSRRAGWTFFEFRTPDPAATD